MTIEDNELVPLEERAERRNNSPDDVRPEPPKVFTGGHEVSYWGPMPEAYAEGIIEIHVHFGLGISGTSVTHDLCAVFYRAEHVSHVGNTRALAGDVGCGRGQQQRQVGQPMFVHVGKLVQYPEGVEGREPLPSCVRLQPLDDCLRNWRDAPDLVQPAAGGGFSGPLPLKELVAEAVNREHRAFGDVWGKWPASVVCEDKLVDEVIERGAEVEQTIPDDGAESSGGLFQGFDSEKLLTSLRLELGECSIRAFFEPPSDFCFQTLQVLERPI
jgi:hypothetical protein